MADFFTNRVPRLPPWSYQGETAVDPVSGNPASSLVAQSWAGHLLGGPERANWPVLCSVPMMAQAAGLSEADYLASCMLPLTAKWGSGNTQPRCPRTLLLNLTIPGILAALSAQLQTLGVLVDGAKVLTGNLFAEGAYLDEETVFESDSGGGFSPSAYVGIAAADKFIGGDLLILNTEGSSIGYTVYQHPSGPYHYYENTNIATACGVQLAAAGARYRKIQAVNFNGTARSADLDGGVAYMAGLFGTYASLAPSFCSVQFLGSTIVPATDAEYAAAAIAVIQSFFGI